MMVERQVQNFGTKSEPRSFGSLALMYFHGSRIWHSMGTRVQAQAASISCPTAMLEHRHNEPSASRT